MSSILGTNLIRLATLAIVLTIFIPGCTNHSQQRPLGSKINPELFGSWRNDNGCQLSLAPESDTIILQSFNDAKQDNFQQLLLDVSKESIFTRLRSRNKQIDFKASFAEGMITIEGYCNQALHKVTD